MPPPPHPLSLPLTMVQAALALGWVTELPRVPSTPTTRAAGLRLRRYLLQRAPQALLAHRDPAARKGRPYLTTLALLRDHCPELFSRTDDTLVLVREALAALTARVEKLEPRRCRAG